MNNAVLSVCGKYRYSLTREVNPDEPQRLVFIMLNPSTADSVVDDPTIRRCIGFTHRFCCGTLEVVNCYAYRATNPKELNSLCCDEAFGPDNRHYISRAIERADRIILAWGSHRIDEDILTLIVSLLKSCGKTAYRLGPPTKQGFPRHPLYLRHDVKLEKMNLEVAR